MEKPEAIDAILRAADIVEVFVVELRVCFFELVCAREEQLNYKARKCESNQ